MNATYVRGAKYHLKRLQCWAYVVRRTFQKDKYPLLSMSGLRQAAKLMDDIKIDRWINWRGAYRQTLVTPVWPSPTYDRMLAKGGMNVDTPGDITKRSWVDLAMVSMTRHCSIGTCEHCSERYNLGKNEVVSMEKLHEVVAYLQERGAGVIAFTGGEPFDRPERLLEILEKGDPNKSEFRVFTTGKGVTPEWARKLEKAGLHSALVSIDGYDAETHDKFRRKQGVFNQSVESMKTFMDAGVFVFGNVTLSKGLIEGDGLVKLWEMLHDIGVPAVQMIEPKTCGGYFKDALGSLFNGADIQRTREIVAELRSRPEDGPVIYWVDEEERAIGCRAGGMLLFHIDSVGNVQPCVFLPVSFGNIMEEDFGTIFERMRAATPDRTHKGCISNLLTPALRSLFEQKVKVPIPIEMVADEFERIYGVNYKEIVAHDDGSGLEDDCFDPEQEEEVVKV